MRIAYFTHSLRSCWNHGNAHFLRGVLRELIACGHEVVAYEPKGAWSLQNLLKDHGKEGLAAWEAVYPELSSTSYAAEADLAELTDGADLVIVHEWNDHDLVAKLGRLRAGGAPFLLLFHDTHHRAVSEPDQMRAYDLEHYDGILAFGATLAEVYRSWGWGNRVFTWHEAADTRLFHPPAQEQEQEQERQGLVWIGNWGEGERTKELKEYLLAPAREAGLPLDIYGVRYHDTAKNTVRRYGGRYHGWIANAAAPAIFARHLATVHVPRRFYTRMLPGIPTIRPFEALACGIPLLSAPWDDCEGLFRVGEDFLMARDGSEMTAYMKRISTDPGLRSSLAASGLETIRSRHTCAHRADELLGIVARLRPSPFTGEGGARSRSEWVGESLSATRIPSPRRCAPPSRVPGEGEGKRMKIAFYGSSLLSSYWNGAATYYRGLLRDLASRGYSITFYEPDAFDRQKHNDIEPPEWARVVVYDATPDALRGVLAEAAQADIVVKASGVGVFDSELLEGIVAHARTDALKLFWDVDAAATLDEMRADESHVVRRVLPRLDMVLTYGGGPPVIGAYEGFGAARCIPVYNALDPTSHHPVAPEPAFAADLAFLGNRLPDREARVEEFFLRAAAALPARSFLIGGNGWETKGMPGNVRHLGHVYTHQHNAFNCTPLAVLNVARDSMANIGFSPATRVFEAAGAAACLITDAWEGIEQFLEPDAEVLVARDGQDVADHVAALTPGRARAIGQAALQRILAEHTYARRGAQVDALFRAALPPALSTRQAVGMQA